MLLVAIRFEYMYNAEYMSKVSKVSKPSPRPPWQATHRLHSAVSAGCRAGHCWRLTAAGRKLSGGTYAALNHSSSGTERNGCVGTVQSPGLHLTTDLPPSVPGRGPSRRTKFGQFSACIALKLVD